MKTGVALIEDLEKQILQKHVTDGAIEVLKEQIKILKNGGVSTFERLATLDGTIIEKSRIVDGKYGQCWVADGKFISIPSYGCKAGKQVWIDAGFKNHADAREKLCAELNTDDYREKNDLYYTLGRKAQAMGMAEKGYKVVEVERPAWVRLGYGGNLLHPYPCIYESYTNFFNGEHDDRADYQNWYD